MFENLKDSYTLEEAKQTIDGMLSQFGDTVQITFREKDAEIIDSYRVNDMGVRHTVCEIIARTGVTKRSYEDLSAEWQVHTVSYRVGYKPVNAKDVSLDYEGDPRSSVRLATKLFDKLGIE